VSDNGRGFDPLQIVNAESFGLNIMRERAEGIGAEFGITSEAQVGTCVSLRWVEETSDERSG
jgi:signal transduction histidine kinase